MKKLLGGLGVFTLMILLFAQCKQDETILNTQEAHQQGKNPIVVSDRNSIDEVYLDENGLVTFLTLDHFQTVYDQMDQELQNFYANLPEEGEEDENAPCEVDEVPVLDDFENQLGYQSERRNYEQYLCDMLEEGLEPEDIDFPVSVDEVILTFLNGDRAFRIDNDFFLFPDDNVAFQVPIQYVGELPAMLNGDVNPLTYQGATVRGGGSALRTSGDVDCETDCCDVLTAAFSTDGFAGSLSGFFNFTGQLPSNTDCGDVQYLWTFGDGASSTQMNPQHTYANGGSYQVQVKVYTGAPCYCEKIFTMDVKVGEDCIAGFKWAKVPGLDCAMSFQDLSTYVGLITGAQIISWEWNFGSGVPSTYNGQNPPSIIFPCNGTYWISLKIKTNVGCENTISLPVAVNSCQCCRKNESQKEKVFTYNNNQNRLKWKQYQVNWLLAHKVHGKMWNFKRKSNNKWKKDKSSDVEVKLTGDVYTNGYNGCTCEVDHDVTANDLRVKHNKAHAKKAIGATFRGKKAQPWKAEFFVNGQLIKDNELPNKCN